MWKVSQIICIGAMAGMSVTDLMFRKVPEAFLILGGAAAILYQCIFRTVEVWLVLGGAGIGCFFLFMSQATREGIGYGDSWGILVLGLYMGMWNLLGVLMGALTLLLLAAMILLVTGHFKKNASLPFYPFLTGGYVLVLLTGVG